MELIIKEGRAYGSRYYTVAPSFHDNPYTWFHLEWHDMENWCKSTFGDTPSDGVWTPNARWYMNNGKFWFREKKDLEWFVLKWQ